MATPDFRAARSCLDYLAGKLSVGIIGALLGQDVLICDREDFVVTKNGVNRRR